MIEITIDKGKIKKVLCVMLIIIAMVIVGCVTGMLFSGYKAAVKQSIAMINKQEPSELMYDKYSIFDSQYDLMELISEIEDEDMTEYADYIEGLKVKYGSKYKITYDISSETELDESELSAIRSSLAKKQEELDAYTAEMKEYCEQEDLDEKTRKKLLKLCEKVVEEYSDIKVTKGYKVELDCKIDGSLSFKDFTIKNMIVAKINGQWLFIGYYGDGEDRVYYLTNPITPEMIYSKVSNGY